jgi:antibiotic biosynthesis monooxygenase (ABM) superfamily enzyme
VTRRLYTTSQDASTPEHGSILPSRAYLKDNLGPTPPSLPPPKWKLCFVIYLGVIMNIFLWSYSGVPLVMATAGLPIGFNLFVSLAISVPILSYAFFPLVMSIPLVSRWLRAPRPERMSAIQKLLDQGLPMFAPKLTPGPSKETVAHFKKLECRLEATRRIQHQISSDLERLRTQLNLERGSHSTSPTIVRSPQDTVRNKVTEGIQRRSIAASDSMKRSKSTPSLANLSLGSDPLPRPNGANGDEEIKEGDHGPITVAVAHWVKWEHILDFDLWTEEITSAMATY